MLRGRPLDGGRGVAGRRPEAVERRRDRRRQLGRRVVGDQPADGLGGAAEDVVGAGRNRGVAGAAVEAEPERGDLLLADRDRHDPAPVGELEHHAAALVERVVAAEVVALADQPGHPDVGGVALLVGLGDEHHVAGRTLAAAGELGEGDDPRRQLALHVGGAAAVDALVADLAGERRHRPVGVRRRHDVGVGHQHQRRPLPRPLDSRDQVQPRRIGPVEIGLDTGLGEVAGDELGRDRLAAGRVRGVDPDQLAGQLANLVAQPLLGGGLGHRHGRESTGARRRRSR